MCLASSVAPFSCNSRCPDAGGIGAHDGGSERRHRAIEIGVRIAGHYHRAGNDVPLFDHYLMRNAGSRWVKIDPVFARERFDLRILREIFGRSILNVVIDREDWLCRIGNRCRADLLEFRNYCAGVVMSKSSNKSEGGRA